MVQQRLDRLDQLDFRLVHLRAAHRSRVVHDVRKPRAFRLDTEETRRAASGPSGPQPHSVPNITAPRAPKSLTNRAKPRPGRGPIFTTRTIEHTRCRKFLQSIPMSENKTIGSMTDRQRVALAQMLGATVTTAVRNEDAEHRDERLAPVLVGAA